MLQFFHRSFVKLFLFLFLCLLFLFILFLYETARICIEKTDQIDAFIKTLHQENNNTMYVRVCEMQTNIQVTAELKVCRCCNLDTAKRIVILLSPTHFLLLQIRMCMHYMMESTHTC